MSTYTTTSKQNILNLGDTTATLDLNTRNSYSATLLGQDAALSNRGAYVVALGYQAGSLNAFGNANIYLGYRAGYRNTNSSGSVYIGTNSGSYVTGGDNIFIGTNTGQYVTNYNQCIYLGTDTGKYVVGGQNILMGYNNTSANSFALSSNNIGLGPLQNIYGIKNIAFGYATQVNASNSMALGNATATTGDNAIVIGNNITNTGCNVCILKNNHAESNFANSNNNYTNINDILINETLSDGTTQTIIGGDRIYMRVGGSNIPLAGSSSVSLSNQNAWLNLYSNVTLGGNGYQLLMSSNTTTLSNQTGGLTIGSNVSLTALNSVISLSNMWGGIEITSNGIVFSPKVVFSDMVVTGNMTFCNTATMCNMSSIVFGGGSGGGGNGTWSDIFPCSETNLIIPYLNQDSNVTSLVSSVFVEDHLYVQSNIYCNRTIYGKLLETSCGIRNGGSTQLMGDILLGGETLCNLNNLKIVGPGAFDFEQPVKMKNLYVDGNFILGSNATLCNFSSSFTSYSVNPQSNIESSNIFADDIRMSCTDSNFIESLVTSDTQLSIIDTSFAINENLYVAKNIYCNRETYTKRLAVSCGLINYGTTRFEGDVQFANSNIFIENNINVYGKGTFNFGQFNMMNANTLNLSESLSATGSIKLVGTPNSNLWWKESLYYNSENTAADLVFTSVNGAQVVFSDNFSPGVLNFTGKHRCNFEDKRNRKDLTGMIVSSTGRYRDLENLEDVKIDEAIPVVKLATRARDPAVFGVISSFEGRDKTRHYKIGNLEFVHQKDRKDQKVIVNSHGEGGIWVCDTEGSFKNGDLITSSDIPGLGARQADDLIRSYTVAKITCDCDFSADSSVKISHEGKSYRKAFVGCIYKI